MKSIIYLESIIIILGSCSGNKFLNRKYTSGRFLEQTLLSFTLLFISLGISAQDTIYFKNNSMIPGKVTEVGITEIKFTRIDDLTSSDYSVPKNEVLVIKYANGLIDSVKSDLPAASTILPERNEKLKYTRNRIQYKGKGISDRSLKSLINTYEVPETRIELKNELKTLNSYKLNRKILAPALFVSGAAAHFYGLNQVFGERGSGFETKVDNNLISVFVAGAVLRISAHVIDIMYKRKSMRKRKEIVDIYNQ